MKIWACAEPKTLFEGFRSGDWIRKMRGCGIEGFLVLSVDVSREIPVEDIRQVKGLLDAEGFDMIGCGLALGHPEGLDTPCFTYHEGWHIRRNINNREVRWCNAVTPRLIEDLREKAVQQKQLGIDKFFWDDDLRQGNHEGDIQGCFCEECLAEFAETYQDVVPKNFSRESLRPVVAEFARGLTSEQEVLRQSWVRFQCDRITRFMAGTTVAGVRNGIMVMHNGDTRHGIDIPAIRAAVPDCLFRVGEYMFEDALFEVPENRQSLVNSVLNHMKLMGDPENIFSESTVYPHGALNPENLRQKILLERKCGLENICLMGLERMNSEGYYTMLRENRRLFEDTRKEFVLDGDK